MYIGRDIIVIEKHLKLFLKNSLAKYDLNAAEGMVLLLLFEKEMNPVRNTIDIHEELFGKTQDEMIDEIHYDKSVMTRTTQTLENKGYIVRSVNKNDSRSYIFTLSDKARDFKETLLAILRQLNEGMLKGIPPENADIVEKTLAQISANVIDLISSKGE